MKCYKQAENIECQQFDQESILLNIQTGIYFRLNEMGGYIWPLLDGEHSIHEIVDSIVDEFEVSADAAEKDFLCFMDELLKEEIVQITEN